jgi:hypothetical protein
VQSLLTATIHIQLVIEPVLVQRQMTTELPITLLELGLALPQAHRFLLSKPGLTVMT